MAGGATGVRTVPDLIRDHRERANLTQRQLADRSGVSVRAVRDIEHGRVRNPRPASLDRLATGLGLSSLEREQLRRAGRQGQAGPAGGRVRVDILGPLAAHTDSGPLPLGPPMQRTLLGLLALRCNEHVSRDEIVDTVWGDDPPRTCLTQIQSAVSRLRSLFEPDRRPRTTGAVLRSTSRGYQLCLDDEGLDARRFERLAAEADRVHALGDAPAAIALFDEAMCCWRGPVLADAHERLRAHPAAFALSRRRLEVALAYADAAVAAGRDACVIGWLRALAADEPLHEPLHARLMLALARSGNRAEALRLHTELRDRLANDLGIEPGEAVQEAYRHVLREPDARPEPPPETAARPAQLPADVPGFVGRGDLLRRLDAQLPGARATPAGTMVICVLSGTAGVGKTTLAVHWAHSVRERFLDGQLYLDLRGFGSVGAPMEPAEGLRLFLHALGVAGKDIPTPLLAQIALYRSLLASRRMLVVLDNARDADQVRPLLPGAAGSMVLVTSRDQLASLVAVEGAEPLALDLFTPAEAEALLAYRIGRHRLASEPRAAEEVITRCARLPLALAVVAARAATRPHLQLATLARQLRDPLNTLTAGDDCSNVRMVISWSYRRLRPEAARLFRLLSLAPGPDISPPATASLAGAEIAQVRPLLDELTRTHLLAEPAPGRFNFHDLLRAYATELAGAHDSTDERFAARRRVLDHYLQTAHAAALAIDPHRDPISLPQAAPGTTPEELADESAALAWYTAEWRVLLSATMQLADVDADVGPGCWQLAWCTANFLDRRGYWQEFADSQALAVADAARRADRHGQVHSHRNLARAHVQLGRHDRAQRHFDLALEVAEQLGDHVLQAHIHRNAAWSLECQHRYGEAIDRIRRAIAAFRIGGHRVGLANALNQLGWYYTLSGEHQRALHHLGQALSMLQELGHKYGEADTWDSLGHAHRQLGEHDLAIACYQRAVGLFRDVGDRYFETLALTHLGETHLARGDAAEAAEAWRAASAILQDLRHPDGPVLRRRLEVLASAHLPG